MKVDHDELINLCKSQSSATVSDPEILTEPDPQVIEFGQQRDDDNQNLGMIHLQPGDDNDALSQSGGSPRAECLLPGLPSLCAASLGDPEVCVAILDGPVDISHPCFQGANLTRLDTLVSDAAGDGAMSAHGTHITSLIFGQPGGPVRGIAPRCRIKRSVGDVHGKHLEWFADLPHDTGEK